MPKPSLPMRLALLVAGTTLPLIIFAAGIVYNNYKQDRQDATQRVLETVRSIRLVLDSEMQRITGALPALRDALAATEVRHQLTVYPGVDHAFHNDTGDRYVQAQATAAWNDTLAWFARYV